MTAGQPLFRCGIFFGVVPRAAWTTPGNDTHPGGGGGAVHPDHPGGGDPHNPPVIDGSLGGEGQGFESGGNDGPGSTGLIVDGAPLVLQGSAENQGWI